nr:MAG TPA: hypothetical protein [Caudoviricetes sp.]
MKLFSAEVDQDKLDWQRTKEVEALNDEYIKKFKFKYIKPLTGNGRYNPYFTFGFHIPELSKTSGFIRPESQKFKNPYTPVVSISLPEIRSKRDLDGYIEKIQDLSNNWSLIEEYYTKVNDIMNKYSK